MSMLTGNNDSNVFLWENGVMTDLQFSGVVRDINDQDQILIETANGGFLWDGGILTDLGGLIDGRRTQPRAINNNTNITGGANIANGNLRAFFWSEGVMLNLGTLGTGTTSEGQAINDSDVVVGYSSIDGCCGYHAFIWEAGVMGTSKNDATDVKFGV